MTEQDLFEPPEGQPQQPERDNSWRDDGSLQPDDAEEM